MHGKEATQSWPEQATGRIFCAATKSIRCICRFYILESWSQLSRTAPHSSPGREKKVLEFQSVQFILLFWMTGWSRLGIGSHTLAKGKGGLVAAGSRQSQQHLLHIARWACETSVGLFFGQLSCPSQKRAALTQLPGFSPSCTQVKSWSMDSAKF